MKVLLDSGAFSAWTLGGSINLSDYVAFIKRHRQLLHSYISLDQIPGQNGRRTIDANGIEAAAQCSYRNHQAMKDAGLTPIPVFHQDDDFKWLQRYLDDGEPWICVAPHGVRIQNIAPWLEDCFAILRTKPNVKVHGLGVTTPTLLRHYRFDTVDSNTWAQQAGHGQILVPLYVGGRPDYSMRARSVSVTERSSMRSNHVDLLTPHKRQQVERFLTEDVGLDLEQIRTSHEARWLATITYFEKLAATNNTTLFYTTGSHRAMRDALLQCGARTHLLSYYTLRRQKQDTPARYLCGGTQAADVLT